MTKKGRKEDDPGNEERRMIIGRNKGRKKTKGRKEDDQGKEGWKMTNPEKS